MNEPQKRQIIPMLRTTQFDNALKPLQVPTEVPEAPCWGPKPPPRSSGYARAGYIIYPFVEGFIETPIGPVPRVATSLSIRDTCGTLGARTGFARNNYSTTPGL